MRQYLGSFFAFCLVAASAFEAFAQVNPPSFSQARGFYDTAFSLALTSDAGTQIRYTVEASAPEATTGTLYTDPIPISTTSVVRAIAYDSSDPPLISVSVSSSYIFLNDVIHQPADIPAASGPFIRRSTPRKTSSTVGSK